MRPINSTLVSREENICRARDGERYFLSCNICTNEM